MKKLISAILALCFIFTLSLNVFAVVVSENTVPNTVETDIAATINPTYTVTIPANVTVQFNATSTNFGQIKVDAAQIHPDKCIKVALKTDKEMENAIDPNKVLPYAVMAGTQEFTFGTYLAKNDSTALKIAIAQTAWDSAFAGSYSDTVTFTVSYVDRVS